MSERPSSSAGDVDDTNEPITGAENTVYFDVLKKLQRLKDKSGKEEYQRDVLDDGAKYITELIIAIEENNATTMNRETGLSLCKGLEGFMKVLGNVKVDEIFKNDPAFARQVFYSYINLFNLTGMKNYLQRLVTDGLIKVLYEQISLYAFLVIILAIADCNLTVADLKEPLDNQGPLLLMLNYLKTDFESDSSSDYSKTSELILNFIWNYADKTVVVPNLIKVGYPAAVLKWLAIAHKSYGSSMLPNTPAFLSQEKRSKSNATRSFISITHNTSRHDDGINALNSLGAIDVIKKIQSMTADSEIGMLCCMILALLSTPEQIKNDRKRMNNALDQLLQSVSNASKSEEYKDDGFHISEPLVVLVKLFNDDRALDYILQHAQVELDASSTVDFFINLLIHFHNVVRSQKDPLKYLTCTVLVNILWSISFQEQYQYKRQLKNRQDLMTLLEKFSKRDEGNESAASSTQYVPKYIENIHTAAEGILLNISAKTSTIDTENHSALPFVPSKQNSNVDALVPQPIQTQNSVVDDDNSKPMIMISYSHDDKVLCYQLEEELRKNTAFDIWIDRTNCVTGDSWEHIAEGIKQSHVVLCLVTKNYTSKSVRREVIYALDKLEKPLLPVFVMRPDLPTWLDIRTCDLTYVRLTDEKQLERTKTAKVIETLQELISGKKTGGNSAPMHYEPVVRIERPFVEEPEDDRNKLVTNTSATKLSQKPVEQWNKADIKEWYQQNEIILELYNLCQFSDGSELLSFAKALLEDEKAQYKSYAEEFPKLYGGKTLLLHQFNKFSNALRKLNSEQNKRILGGQPTSATTTTKSQTCEIL